MKNQHKRSLYKTILLARGHFPIERTSDQGNQRLHGAVLTPSYYK
jgi:hypothetical protein